MNKKKIGIIAGIVLLILGVYLIFNPTWITKPKYMVDSQYCEQNNECVVSHTKCDAINLYNFKENYKGTSCFQKTCGTTCANNKCQLIKECDLR